MMSFATHGWRRVEVPAERLAGWIDRFEIRHGSVTVAPAGDGCELRAVDGALARIQLVQGAAADRDSLVAAAADFDRFGLLLVRRGGFAVGRVEDGVLVASRCGTRYVQGRTKAGGWSQQRYARRRANQADTVAAGAADALNAVLVEGGAPLVGGGDKALVRQALELSGRCESLQVSRWLDVPDPRRQVLERAVSQARAARITLNALA